MSSPDGNVQSCCDGCTVKQNRIRKLETKIVDLEDQVSALTLNLQSLQPGRVQALEHRCKILQETLRSLGRVLNPVDLEDDDDGPGQSQHPTIPARPDLDGQGEVDQQMQPSKPSAVTGDDISHRRKHGLSDLGSRASTSDAFRSPNRLSGEGGIVTAGTDGIADEMQSDSNDRSSIDANDQATAGRKKQGSPFDRESRITYGKKRSSPSFSSSLAQERNSRHAPRQRSSEPQLQPSTGEQNGQETRRGRGRPAGRKAPKEPSGRGHGRPPGSLTIGKSVATQATTTHPRKASSASKPSTDEGWIPTTPSQVWSTREFRKASFQTELLSPEIVRIIHEYMVDWDKRKAWEEGNTARNQKCINEFSHKRTPQWPRGNQDYACLSCSKHKRICVALTPEKAPGGGGYLRLLPSVTHWPADTTPSQYDLKYWIEQSD